MAKSRKLKGRGVGPSKARTLKVFPAPEEPEEEEPEEEGPMEEGAEPITIETYTKDQIKELQAPEMDRSALERKFPFLLEEMENPVASLQADLEGLDLTIRVAMQAGEPIAIHIKGESADTESEEPMFDHIYPEGSTAFDEGQEGSRRRVKKQTRRTKRNRRNLKGKKLRKLTARRR